MRKWINKNYFCYYPISVLIDVYELNTTLKIKPLFKIKSFNNLLLNRLQ